MFPPFMLSPLLVCMHVMGMYAMICYENMIVLCFEQIYDQFSRTKISLRGVDCGNPLNFVSSLLQL